MTTQIRASLDELRDFANKVREAGGGNPLDALMPAIPANPTQCLIAKNLNFNCTVNKPDSDGPWHMHIDDGEIAEKIAKELGVPLRHQEPSPFTEESWSLPLPEQIGQVAADFDISWEMVDLLSDAKREWDIYFDEEKKSEYDGFKDYFNQEWSDDFSSWDRNEIDYDLIKEMWPYIEESMKEVQEIGIFDDQGNLIL